MGEKHSYRATRSSSTLSDSSITELRNKLSEFDYSRLGSGFASESSLGQELAIDDTGDVNDGATGLRRSDSSSSIPFIDLQRLLYIPDFDFGMGIDQVSGSTKKKLSSMKMKTKQRLSKLESNKDFVKLQEVLNQRLTKFDARIHRNLESSSTEKLFYALAVFSIAAGGFIIGKYPDYFHVYHTALFCLLMPIRFYSYFKQSFQYYLADLCYYVNLLLMLFIWWFPSSKSLFVSVFSLSLGTLSFAVITWRNSLVLHSIEKTTSSFIHVMPPITMFVLVHELPEDYLHTRFPAVREVTQWNFVYGIIITSVYYTIWQVSYHYFITIRKKKEIENGKVTSFTYLKKKNQATVLGRFVNSLPYNWMQVTAFTLIQFFYQILTMVFCPVWFKYKHMCGAFVTFIFILASYNGATYYIDVFGKRFEKEVTKLRSEIDDLQARIETNETSPVIKATDAERMSRASSESLSTRIDGSADFITLTSEPISKLDLKNTDSYSVDFKKR